MSLFRTAARASVATRVVGNTHRRQQQRWAAQDGTTQAQAPQAPVPTPVPAPVQPSAPAPAPNTTSMLDQLTQLGQLRDAGVLSDAEFETQKARILTNS